MKNRTSKIVSIVIILALLGWLGAGIFAPKPEAKRVNVKKDYEPKFQKEGDLWITNPLGDTLATMDVEYCTTQEEISYGMMFRKTIDPKTGMLFFMPVERMQSFYMKNTYVSLDIIFIDSQQKIVSIQKNAVPRDESSLPSTGPAKYVLEIQGGLSDQLGLKSGDKVSWRDL